MKMSITISVTFLNTLCNLINKFDKTQNIHFSPEEKTKRLMTQNWLAGPSHPVPPTVRWIKFISFFQPCGAVEEEMKINDKIQTQTIKQNERPPTN